jgi:hypothetical protein
MAKNTSVAQAREALEDAKTTLEESGQQIVAFHEATNASEDERQTDGEWYEGMVQRLEAAEQQVVDLEKQEEEPAE